MSNIDSSILKKVSPVRIILPIVLGLSIIGYIIYRDWNSQAVETFSFTSTILLFLFISLLMMVCRDVGYMIRLRILSNGELSWKQIFYIIMLWEFASAISPSAIGGTTVATYFIYKEKNFAWQKYCSGTRYSFFRRALFYCVFPDYCFLHWYQSTFFLTMVILATIMFTLLLLDTV